ncbi:MAG: beta-lactamase family protein [Xanthomonadaceae bacterium]|nr:beta-lactamase family protein [Xanthomonadaceae bacterium]
MAGRESGIPACPRDLISIGLALVLTLTSFNTLAQAAFDTTSLDHELDTAVARYHLPGVAVGVVKDGEVIYRGTRGELEIGGGQRVDSGSLFKIASNSKAMTAALLGRLVDQGKLRWDDPVSKHLPDFQMQQDWVTREIQVRDLLIHNSGLPAGAGDLMLWPEPNHFTRADVLHGMRYLKPKWSFRSRYAYDNTLYIVAGEVAAAVGGAPYETLMRREVFEPLGLSRCRVGAWSLEATGNVAQPHRLRDGRYEVVNRDPANIPESTMAAAGGVRCSLDDMLKWASTWLQPDRVGVQADGKPWLSDAQREAIWMAQQPMPLSSRMRRWDDSHFYAYGYGWRLSDVDGTARMAHTGTLSGMYSSFTLLPEKHIGIVVLINGDADEARTVLMQALTRHFTAPDDNPGVEGYAKWLADERTQAVEQSPSRIPDTRDRRPAAPTELAGKLGRWRDPWFGDVTICPLQGEVRFAAAKSPRVRGQVMTTRHGWLVDWDGDAVSEAWLRFGPGNGLTMAKLDPDGDFSDDFEDLDFHRVGDCPAK